MSMVEIYINRRGLTKVDPSQLSSYQYVNDGIYGEPFYRAVIGGLDMVLDPEEFKKLEPYLPVNQDKKMQAIRQAFDEMTARIHMTNTPRDFELLMESVIKLDELIDKSEDS